MCLNDMFEALGKSLDPEIDFIAPVLLKKTAEANRFINNQAESALTKMIANTSEEKCLSSLIVNSDAKNASVRAISALLINECVIKMVQFSLYNKL